MIYNIILVIAIFFVPILIIKYRHFMLTKIFGTIGIAYMLGILLAFLVYVFNKLGMNIKPSSDIGEIGSHLAISIAIPLLLFSANLKEAKKLSKTVLKSFLSLIISTILVASFVFYIYGKKIGFGAELCGMSVGLYTGGTPNLNAIAGIFGLDSTTTSVANLSDMVIGALFYVFLLVACKPLLSLFMKSEPKEYMNDCSYLENNENLDLYKFTLTKKLTNRFLLAFVIAVFSALLGVIMWVVLGMQDGKMTDVLVPVMMINVTVFGIIGSFNKRIRETKGMNVLGQYFILVFSFALASSMDFSRVQGLFFDIFIVYGSITIGVFVIHVLISKLLDIDVDCTIVTLTAGVYGPAFVPAITKQIKNDKLTVPGLIIGSIGYAIGTFLGMILVWIYLL